MPKATVQYNFQSSTMEAASSYPRISAINLGAVGLASFQIQSTLGYPTGPMLSLTTAGTDIATTRYFRTVLSADTDFRIVDISFLGARGGAATPRGIHVRTSQDGYVTSLPMTDGTTALNTVRPTWATKTAVATSLVTARSIEVRFYPYAPTNGASIELDNITFTLDVPNPPERVKRTNMMRDGGTISGAVYIGRDKAAWSGFWNNP